MIRTLLLVSLLLACNNDKQAPSTTADQPVAIAKHEPKAPPPKVKPAPAPRAPKRTFDCAALLTEAEVNQACGRTYTGAKTRMEGLSMRPCDREFTSGPNWDDPHVTWTMSAMSSHDNRGWLMDLDDRVKGGATEVPGLGVRATQERQRNGKTIEIVFVRDGLSVHVSSSTCAPDKLIELARKIDQRVTPS